MSVKSEKKIIQEQSEKIAKLEKDLQYEKDYRARIEREKSDLEREIESVHTALDVMFVPRLTKVGYSEKVMTIASRLWAWQAGARIKPSEKTIIE